MCLYLSKLNAIWNTIWNPMVPNVGIHSPCRMYVVKETPGIGDLLASHDMFGILLIELMATWLSMKKCFTMNA